MLPSSNFLLHLDFYASVVLNFVLLMPFSLRVLSSAAGRRVRQVDPAVFAIELGHIQIIINEDFSILNKIGIVNYLAGASEPPAKTAGTTIP